MTAPSVQVPEQTDVAFSFLAADEPLASRLAGLIKSRVRVFLFSERQRDIAGTDGVETFTHMFGTSAQFVVVLYRDGYGTTKWTRIVETAIKGRGLELGWHSVFLISLDGTKPKWLPPSQLYYGLDTFGEGTAADAIVGRFGDLGLIPKPETIQEIAQRAARDVEGRERAMAWLESESASDTANTEVAKLESRICDLVDALPPALRASVAGSRRKPVQFRVHVSARRATFAWSRQFSNTLQGSALIVREEALRGATLRLWEEVSLRSVQLELDHRTDRPVWRLDKDDRATYSTDELVDYFLNRLIGGDETQATESRPSIA